MLELYNFQQQAVEELQQLGKHIVLAGTGMGKGAMALHWLKSTGKKKWLFITTPSKVASHDVENEAIEWFGEEFVSSLSSFTVLSWGKLKKWVRANYDSLDEYAIVGDEIHKMRNGSSSQRGMAFLQIAKRTDCWTGYTATPGDRWLDFVGYFVAGGYVKNNTAFKQNYCNIQRYKGFPEVVGYYNIDEMRQWWAEMTVVPDTSAAMAELPPERHFVHTFKPDPYYRQFKKTRIKTDGEFADTPGSYCAEQRRLCFSKEKQQWLRDYLENLGEPCVLFYWFTGTGDKLEQLAYESIPKGSHVWRISGSSKDIPKAGTIGKYDVVICQWNAGSESLNLQFLAEWVSVEPCYAYGTSEQGRGRIKRIGQHNDKMQFHYLKCPNTIEDGIYLTLKTKGEFSEEEWARKEGIVN